MRWKNHAMQANTSLLDVMNALEQLTNKIVYIVDERFGLLGSITDGDVRRYAMKHRSFEARAEQVMKSPCVFATSIPEAEQLMHQKQLGSVALVNASMKLIDVWFEDDTSLPTQVELEDKVIPVVMMAGGKGERLYPYTAVLPKPLIPIQGVPIAQRIIERFALAGLHHFVLSLNYKKNIIKAYFDEVMDHLDISYYEEVEPTGTAGSLRAMRDSLQGDFFVINCDNLIDVDLADMIRFHKENNNVITVVSALKPVTVPYGVFDLDGSGNVMQLREKPVINQFINTGMYLLSPEVFDCIPDKTFFHMTDVIQICVENHKQVRAYVVKENAFMDMGQMDELNEMQRKFRQ